MIKIIYKCNFFVNFKELLTRNNTVIIYTIACSYFWQEDNGAYMSNFLISGKIIFFVQFLSNKQKLKKALNNCFFSLFLSLFL